MKLDPEQMNFGDARVCRNDGRGQARVRDHEWSWLAALDDFRNWPIREAA